MYIHKLHIQNFKRFTDLTIDLQKSDHSKLVLLIGANGSGKSSIMDVFQCASDIMSQGWPDIGYINKGGDFDILLSTDQGSIDLGAQKPFTDHILAQKLYTRPSIRIVPEIQQGSNDKNDSVSRSIDFERRFDNDVRFFIGTMVTQLGQAVSGESDGITTIRETVIHPLNTSLKRIFGLEDDICLQFDWFEVGNVGMPPKLFFTKGSSKIDFTVLSHGEKQVIIILLNFMMRKEELADKVIFIDEMDVHLHTSLQYNLIKEIVEVQLPSDSQLRTASHALGFIQYAKNTIDSSIIDFDNLNFDLTQKLVPMTGETVYDIAVPQSLLPILFAGKKIYFCENKNSIWYNSLKLTDTVFVPANDKTGVIIQALSNNVCGVIDRDYMTDEEKYAIETTLSIKILEYYCIETYIYHPNNLESYYTGIGQSFDKGLYISGLRDAKNAIKEDIKISKVKNARDGYYFFKQQHEYTIKRSSDAMIGELLDSDDIEQFLKVFSLKDYATQLPARKNISKNDLMKTSWMCEKVKNLF